MSQRRVEALKAALRKVPDYPKPGVLFYDITPILGDYDLFTEAIMALCTPFTGTGSVNVDKVVGMESRGFIFGVPVALELGAGFVPARKPGKLPWKVRKSPVFQKEYGPDSLEIHEDAIQPGEKVLIVDDLLAVGGTAEATVELVKSFGANCWNYFLGGIG